VDKVAINNLIDNLEKSICSNQADGIRIIRANLKDFFSKEAIKFVVSELISKEHRTDQRIGMKIFLREIDTYYKSTDPIEILMKKIGYDLS
jgi:hypothetical protein